MQTLKPLSGENCKLLPTMCLMLGSTVDMQYGRSGIRTSFYLGPQVISQGGGSAAGQLQARAVGGSFRALLPQKSGQEKTMQRKGNTSGQRFKKKKKMYIYTYKVRNCLFVLAIYVSRRAGQITVRHVALEGVQIRINKRASVVCWNRFHQAARYLPTNSDACRKVTQNVCTQKVKEKTSKVSQASQESPKKPKLLSRAG